MSKALIASKPLPELLSASRLLERLWPDQASRPSLRWLREQQRRRAIPVVKWGVRTFFVAEDVAAAIEKLTIRAKS
jgi:hypothetical protein